jgi:hypothetical protein
LKANCHLHVLIEDSIASVRGRQLCLEQTHWRIQGDNSMNKYVIFVWLCDCYVIYLNLIFLMLLCYVNLQDNSANCK